MLKVATALPNEPYREYKDVERVYSGSTEIDKILDKNGNVLFAVNKEVEGTPALAYKGKEETNLKNYRIYGQTVDGESVGDRTENLFDKSGSQYGNNLHWVPPLSLVYSDAYYGSPIMDVTGLNTITRSYTGTGANYFSTSDLSQFVNVSNIGTVDAGVTVNVPDGYTKYVFNIPNTIRPDSIMVNSGSTALPYEPYGYKVPVTVEGKNLLNSNLTRFPYAINGASYFTSAELGAVFLIPIKNNTAYTIKVYSSETISVLRLGLYNKSSPINGDYVTNLQEVLQTTSPSLTIINTTYKYLVVQISSTYYNGYGLNNLMLNTGSTALPYEPYHAPVTTPIYLPEQIKMVGDEAEYIDYGEQKIHRVRKNLANNKHTRSLVNYTITENDNYIHAVGTNTTSNTQAIVLSNLVDLEAGEYDLVNNSSAAINVDYYDENGIAQYFSVPRNSIKTFTYPSNVRRALNVYKAIIAGNSIDAYFQVMIVKHGNDTTIYEPYIENTEVDVTLPALPVLPGTNVLSVGTEVQPSNIHLKGRIKEVL